MIIRCDHLQHDAADVLFDTEPENVLTLTFKKNHPVKYVHFVQGLFNNVLRVVK